MFLKTGPKATLPLNRVGPNRPEDARPSTKEFTFVLWRDSSETDRKVRSAGPEKECI
jgi:hypothetical protein